MIYKGAVLGSRNPTDINTFVSAGGRLGRFFINFGVNTPLDFNAYKAALRGAVSDILSDKIVPHKVLCLFAQPGKPDTSSSTWKNRWYEVCQIITTLCKDNPQVYGLEFLNEPNIKNRSLRDLFREVTKRVRLIDPNVNVIATPKLASPAELMDFRPVYGIYTYTCHVWAPLSYSHQGVLSQFPTIRGPMVSDWYTLSKNFRYLKDWQAKYKQRLYIGEFGAARWAPGCDGWLFNHIKEYNLRGYDWTYHSFAEAHMWESRYSTNFNNGVGEIPQDTDRWKVIKNGWNAP